MIKYISLKFTMLSLITALIIISSISIIAVSFFGAKQSLFYLTENMMNYVSKSVSEKLTKHLESAEKFSVLIEKNILDKKINLENGNEISEFLAGLIAVNKDFTSIDVGFTNGNKFQAKRMDDNSVSRRLVFRQEKNIINQWIHSNPQYYNSLKNYEENLETGYDPRNRPWWKTAVQTGKMSWTDIYPSGSGLYFSHVNPIYNADRSLLGVSAIDLNILDISFFLNTLKIGKSGIVFIFNDKFEIVAMPMKSISELSKILNTVVRPNGWRDYSLKKPEEITNPRIRTALISFRDSFKSQNSQFFFTQDDDHQKNIVSFSSLSELKLNICVVIAENDILGYVKTINKITLAISFVLLIFSIIIAFFISRAIARPLTELTAEVDKIKNLDLDSSLVINTRITEVAHIHSSIENMKKGLKSFKKYVPADLVKQLIKMQKEAVIGGENRCLTLFFSDIAGFTSISEKLTPEQLVEKLDIYFQGLTKTILEHQGTVDKYIGDAIMGFWGAPNHLKDHAQKACMAAVRCIEFINHLNDNWIRQNQDPLVTRIGLHTGEVIVGNMGYDERMNYTVLGDSVNLASRLEGLNKYYGTSIIISEVTYQAAGNYIAARKIDVVAVKGKSQGVTIYELIGLTSDLDKFKLNEISDFNTAFELYLNRKWKHAAQIFNDIYIRSDKKDKPAEILIARCNQYSNEPPDENWNGIYIFKTK